MALDLPPELLSGFPEAFRQGMATRSVTKLGDAADDHPEHWVWHCRRSPGGVHAMLMVWAHSQAELDARLAQFGAQADEAGGITLVGFQPVAALGGSDREHFGFRDPISQPAIAGDRSAQSVPTARNPSPPASSCSVTRTSWAAPRR